MIQIDTIHEQDCKGATKFAKTVDLKNYITIPKSDKIFYKTLRFQTVGFFNGVTGASLRGINTHKPNSFSQS